MQLAQTGIINTFPDRVPAFIEPTAPDADVILDLKFYQLTSLWQELALLPSGIPTTPVTANSDPVGTIIDQSRSCLFARATASANRPLLGTNGLIFDGTNDSYTVISTSLAYFRNLHQVDPIYGIRFKMIKNLDGSARTVFISSSGSTAGWGVVLQLTAANKVRFILHRGTAGTAMVDYTTTRTINIASGLTAVHININGIGSNACSIRMHEADTTVTTETFTILQGVAHDPTSTLTFGGASAFNGTLNNDFKIVDGRVWTTPEMTAYEADAPANTTTLFTPIKEAEYDFTDTAYVFADLAETTPITNNVEVLSVLSKANPTYANYVKRRAIGVATTGLIWLSNQLNGLGCVVADGSGSRELVFTEDMIKHIQTTYTRFIVLRNTDATFGSQWDNGDTVYGVITGNAYSGNAANTGDAAQPYWVSHSVGNNTSSAVPISRSNGYNIIIQRVFGQTVDEWSQAGVKYTKTGFSGMSWLSIGKSTSNGVPEFHPDGAMVYILHYLGYIDDSQINAKRLELMARFGISALL